MLPRVGTEQSPARAGTASSARWHSCASLGKSSAMHKALPAVFPRPSHQSCRTSPHQSLSSTYPDALSKLTTLSAAAGNGAPAKETHQSFIDTLADLEARLEAEKVRLEAEKVRLLHEVKDKQDEKAAQRAEEEKEKKLEALRREIANLRAKLAADPEAGQTAEGQLALLESQLMTLLALPGA